MVFSSLRLCLDRRKQDGEGPGKYFYGVIGQARGRFFSGSIGRRFFCATGFGFWWFRKTMEFFMSFPPFILFWEFAMHLHYFFKGFELEHFDKHSTYYKRY